jgi:hypothetical protein
MCNLISTPTFIDFTVRFTDILTLIAVILTLFTLIEIRSQRQSMYIPDLFLGDRYVNFYGFDFHDRYSNFEFDQIEDPKKEKQSDEIPKKFYSVELFLHNIGFGAAKSVKIKWEYDIEKFIELLNPMVDKNQFGVSLNKQDGRQGAYIEHILTEHFSSCTYSYLMNGEKDVVLPKHTIEKSPIINVPETYTTLLSYFIAFKYEMFDPKSKKHYIFDELNEIPPLSLNLTYYDIRNKKYQKEISLKFMVSGEYNDNLERVDFGKHKIGMYCINNKEKR